MPDEKAPSSGAFLPASLMYFCSGEPMHFLSGVDTATTNGRSAKYALTKWLTENAANLGLVDSQGKTNSSGIEEIAKVANWQLTGGAPRTSGSS
jgi:hypothetical protein